MPLRSGPAHTVGRWSLLPWVEADPTARTVATAELLLDRYGVLTRGAVAAEDVPGGFAGIYRVLAAAEEAGRVRRGYFVEGLGASQFASTGAVDLLRAERTDSGVATVLAATDPANPFGAALPWPTRSEEPGDGRGHQPGRRSGAIVVLIDGEVVMYVEKGGRSLLTFATDPVALAAAARALADAVRAGTLGRITVEKADGGAVLGSDHPVASALADAGFHLTTRGLRMRR